MLINVSTEYFINVFSKNCLKITKRLHCDGDDDTVKVDAGEFSRQFKRVRTIASMQQDSGGGAA